MQHIFSPHFKYSTWRKLWVALAKAEKEMGLPITSDQIKELEAKIDKVDYALARTYEKELKHDVMAHIHAYGDQCPLAKGILHMGATSAFVTDNTDLIQMKEGLFLLQNKLSYLLQIMGQLAEKYASLSTLSYTHLQPAQPTTVGKRICLWLQDFLFDFKDLIERQESLQFLGLKGATGTQASFVRLFDGNEDKAEKLDQLLAKEMGFDHLFTISGQTYTRKQDMRILSVLEGLAASAHKCATDLRLLAHMEEFREPLGKNQVGSSAMPHKQNPIYAERACALARFLISLSTNGAYTLATQWLERSLDDSANRRLTIPEAFLTADSLLSLMIHLFSNPQINQAAITKNLQEKLPLLAKENILMESVKKGKDRQKIHELLRTDQNLKETGLSEEELAICFKPDTGRASAQVGAFLKKEVAPLLKKYPAQGLSMSELEI